MKIETKNILMLIQCNNPYKNSMNETISLVKYSNKEQIKITKYFLFIVTNTMTNEGLM